MKCLRRLARSYRLSFLAKGGFSFVGVITLRAGKDVEC
jgi:hypothetical protein